MFPRLDVAGNCPVKSVHTRPCSWSIGKAVAPTRCSRRVGPSGGGGSYVSRLGVCLVLRIPCLVRWSRPIIVGIEFSMCLRTRRLQSPGHVVRNPLSIARHKVVTGGKPAAAWRNMARRFAVGWWYALRAVAVFVGRGVGGACNCSGDVVAKWHWLVGIGMYQSLLDAL